MKLLRNIYLYCLLALPEVALAQIPTTDVANLIQQFITYSEQIEQGVRQIQQIENQMQQIQQLQRQAEAVEGVRDVVRLLNTPALRDVRDALPGDTYMLMRRLSSGNVPDTTAEYRRLLTQIYETFDSVDPGNRGVDRRRSLTQIANENIELNDREAATAVIANAAVYSASQTAVAYQAVTDAIVEETDNSPDLKASVDINNKMLAQISYQLNLLTQVMLQTNLRATEQPLIEKQRQANFRSANNINY